MSQNSSIEWTDASWNPVTGCDEISPGCDHCYAKVFAERWRGIPGHAYEQGFDLRLWPDRIALPLHWKKPRRIFVNSMSDLFHKDVPGTFIRDVFITMELANWHTYQVLTKRPKRMARFFANYPGVVLPPHIWIGTTIESDAYTWRADELRKVPAAVRFVSAEPLLSGLPSLNLDGIHWLIVGGESGHGARPMHPDWARSLQRQCEAAGVAFFYKQHGEYIHESQIWSNPRGPDLGDVLSVDAYNTLMTSKQELADRGWQHDDRSISYRVGKKAAGRLLDGRTWDEFPIDTTVVS